MDKNAARRILRNHLEQFRRLSHEELRQLIGSVETEEFVDSEGICYQLEVQFFWDGAANGDIRVMGNIDDGGWRAFVPLTDDFIKSPHVACAGE